MKRLLLAAVLSAALVPAVEAQSVDVADLPDPTLDTFEEGVRNQLTELRKAVKELIEKGTATDREIGYALGQLGSLYLLYDFAEASEACLVPARRLDPENFLWPYYLAALYTLEGNLEGAREALDKAVKLDPTSVPAWIRRGNLFLDQGNIDLAEESFLRVMELEPGNSAAHLGLGQVAFRRNDFEAAVPELKASLAEQPEGSVAHYFLAMSYRRLGDMKAAREHMELNDGEASLFFDEPLLRLQRFNVSREALFTMGVEAMRRGEPERALLAFERTLEVQPDDPETHYNIGMALFELGDSEKAESHLRRAVELRPDYRDAHFNLAVLLALRDAHDEATVHFQRAAEIDPNDLRAKVELAAALTRIDETDRAVEILEEALTIDAAMVEARLSLASLQAAQGRLDAARENLERILGLAPGAVEARAEAHLVLATLDPEAAPEETVGHLRAAVELSPELTEAHRLLALELAQQGAFVQAAEAFGRVSELEPGDPHVYFGQSMALIFDGSYEEAQRVLEDGLEELPASLPLKHLLARLLATCPDPAVRDGRRALELSLEVAESALTIDHAETLAMAYAELGRFDEAVRWQERVVSEAAKTPAGVSPVSRRRLDGYREGEPVRAPWLGS